MAFLRGPLVIALAVLGSALGPPAARGQEAETIAPAERPGPTLEARAVTARSMARTPHLPAPRVLPRYFAYQRDFDDAFGYATANPFASDTTDFMQDLKVWVIGRWGETTFYDWVERALVMYAHVQASTRFQKKGFDMGVEVDDVAEGKLGVRVSRALE